MKSAHFHAIGALQCKIVVFGRFLGGSGFSLLLVTWGNGWLILMITRDDFCEKRGGVSVEENPLGIIMFLSWYEGLPDA